MVATSRPPDFYVIGESGRKCPAFLQGEYRAETGETWLVGFTLGNGSTPFLIDPENRRLVTWAGTITGVEIIPAEPVPGVWEVMTEQIDGWADEYAAMLDERN
jgi:hypothetical protein